MAINGNDPTIIDIPPQTPYLMLPFPVSPSDFNTHQLFTLSSDPSPSTTTNASKNTCINRVHRLHLPELSDKVHHGSNHGELLLVLNAGFKSFPFIFNPFTRSKVPLPPLPLPSRFTDCGRHYFSRECKRHFHIDTTPKKTSDHDSKFLGPAFASRFVASVAVTADRPISSPEFRITVIHGWDLRLAFCGPQDEEWTDVVNDSGKPFRGIKHLAYSNGRFYVGLSNCLLICDISVSPATASPVLDSLLDGRNKEKRYFVGSDQELLLVKRWSERSDKDNFENFTKLTVFRLADRRELRGEEKGIKEEENVDEIQNHRIEEERVEEEEEMKKMRWVRVESIGEKAIFLSEENSFVISTVGLSDYSPDCIYFYERKDNLDDASIEITEFCMRENAVRRKVNCCQASSWLCEPLWLQTDLQV